MVSKYDSPKVLIGFPTGCPAADGWLHDPDGDSHSQTAFSDEPRELTYVDIDTFLATF